LDCPPHGIEAIGAAGIERGNDALPYRGKLGVLPNSLQQNQTQQVIDEISICSNFSTSEICHFNK
jgi:hypothetical protein